MTKAKMLETLQEEYNANMYLRNYFDNKNDEKHADYYWRAAFQTERIARMLFGDDVDLFERYIATL